MTLVQHATRLLKTDINGLLATAENPRSLLERLIREMDDAIVALRRETVNAVARERRLEQQVHELSAQADELERQALEALELGNREETRRLLGQRVEVLKSHERLCETLRGAAGGTRRVESDLLRMQELAAAAGRGRAELIRRGSAAGRGKIASGYADGTCDNGPSSSRCCTAPA